MHGDAVRSHIAARSKPAAGDAEEIRPFAGLTAPQAQLYRADAAQSIDQWLNHVQQEAKPPNQEHSLFLRALGSRSNTERTEELQGT